MKKVIAIAAIGMTVLFAGLNTGAMARSIAPHPNNIHLVKVKALADLYPMRFSGGVNAMRPGEILLAAKVKNRGAGGAGTFRVKVKVRTIAPGPATSWSRMDVQVVTSLDAGAVKPMIFRHDVAAGATYEYNIIVDNTDLVTESDESNNQTTTTVEFPR